MLLAVLTGCGPTGGQSSNPGVSAGSGPAGIPGSTGDAATVTWLPPTTNTNGTVLTDLAGYRIYYGQSSTALTEFIQITNVGLTAYVLQNLSPGTWYFAVRAYTKTGTESSLSNIASKTIL